MRLYEGTGSSKPSPAAAPTSSFAPATSLLIMRQYAVDSCRPVPLFSPVSSGDGAAKRIENILREAIPNLNGGLRGLSPASVAGTSLRSLWNQSAMDSPSVTGNVHTQCYPSPPQRAKESPHRHCELRHLYRTQAKDGRSRIVTHRCHMQRRFPALLQTLGSSPCPQQQIYADV